MTKSQEALFKMIGEAVTWVFYSLEELEQGKNEIEGLLKKGWKDRSPDSIQAFGDRIGSTKFSVKVIHLESSLNRLSTLCGGFATLPKGASRRASPPQPCPGCSILLANRSAPLCEKCAERVQHATIKDSEWVYKTLCKLANLQVEPPPEPEEEEEGVEDSSDAPTEDFNEEIPEDRESEAQLLHCDPGTATCKSIGESLGGLSPSKISSLARANGISPNGRAVWRVNGMRTTARSYNLEGWRKIRDAAVAQKLISMGHYSPPDRLAPLPPPPPTLPRSITLRRSSPPVSGKAVPALSDPAVKLLKP